MSVSEVPPDKEYVEVTSGRRIHPYSMVKHVNRKDVEVVYRISDEDDTPIRWVTIQNGRYEAWVRARHQDEYGYEITGEERVRDSEFEAINLKHRAMDGELSLQEVLDAFDSDASPAVLEHRIIAAFYAGKADPDVSDEQVDRLREYMHEQTRHVDTSHLPTVMGILEDTLDSEVEPDDGS